MLVTALKIVWYSIVNGLRKLLNPGSIDARRRARQATAAPRFFGAVLRATYNKFAFWSDSTSGRRRRRGR